MGADTIRLPVQASNSITSAGEVPLGTTATYSRCPELPTRMKLISGTLMVSASCDRIPPARTS